MELIGRDGDSLTLLPRAWESTGGTGTHDDHWLMVEGGVVMNGQRWSFTDPCLLIGEARELAGWLRGVARGLIPAESRPSDPADPDWEPSLAFLEPALAFSVEERGGNGVVVAVDLSYAAAPPETIDHPVEGPAATLRLRTDADGLFRAAETWERELDALPARGSPPRG